MPAATKAGEPVEGRHAQPTDRHQQPVITNVDEGHTPAK
jgi:hypothetical protein